MNKEQIYIIEGLCCANCAAKMERKIQQLPQVSDATLTFATKQLKISAPDPDTLFSEIEGICQSVEDHVKLIKKGTSIAQPTHHERNGIWEQHTFDIISIIIGAILFASSLLIVNNIYVISASIAAYLILGWKVLLTAGKNILRGQIFDENFLMGLATLAAFVIGETAEGVGVMLFYRIGELFEHIAVEKSRNQIMSAVDMRPEVVNKVVSGQHDNIEIVPAGDIVAGDIVLVRPGDRIPLDGIVIEGESRIDTSPVTGEPVPAKAISGTQIMSGCINIHGVLKIQVQKPLSESMVTKILDSVENAAAGKPKIDKFITRFAKIYTPIVVILAILTAVIPSLFTGQWYQWLHTAITFLVISCPCALVISVPLAFFSGIGAASKLGILFKGGLAIEALRKIKAVVMDKTGTLTKGTFAVNKIVSAGQLSDKDLLRIAASCEINSTHPVAASILEAAAENKITPDRPFHINELAGMGIKASLPEGIVLCGNLALMQKYGVTVPNHSVSEGNTIIHLALEFEYAGHLVISDIIKEDSSDAITQLRSRGLVPAMLTGDVAGSAKTIASQLGIDRVFAELLPQDKLTSLAALREEFGPVMYVGDGINDAPVLAGADVGAAMGTGADAAIEAADVVFMTSAVTAIPEAIRIADATGRTATQNITFALVIKLLVIIMGLAGFANIWAAVFADTGVAMLCILNSLRILWKKF